MFVYLICIYFLTSLSRWLRQILWPQLHSYCHVNKNRPFYWYLIKQQTCQRWFWNGFWKQICIFGSCHNHINLNIRAICKILILRKLKAENLSIFIFISTHRITLHNSFINSTSLVEIPSLARKYVLFTYLNKTMQYWVPAECKISSELKEKYH